MINFKWFKIITFKPKISKIIFKHFLKTPLKKKKLPCKVVLFLKLFTSELNIILLIKNFGSQLMFMNKWFWSKGFVKFTQSDDSIKLRKLLQ